MRHAVTNIETGPVEYETRSTRLADLMRVNKYNKKIKRSAI